LDDFKSLSVRALVVPQAFQKYEPDSREPIAVLSKAWTAVFRHASSDFVRGYSPTVAFRSTAAGLGVVVRAEKHSKWSRQLRRVPTGLTRFPGLTDPRDDAQAETTERKGAFSSIVKLFPDDSELMLSARSKTGLTISSLEDPTNTVELALPTTTGTASTTLTRYAISTAAGPGSSGAIERLLMTIENAGPVVLDYGGPLASVRYWLAPLVSGFGQQPDETDWGQT
jgi:hypothetical protein